MDAKITKKRLAHLFSYDWFKIVLFAVALIFVWNFLFSALGTKITPAQEFTIFHYTGTFAGEDYESLASDTKKRKVFSYDILETVPTLMSVSDLEKDALMLPRVQTGTGDAVLVPKNTFQMGEEYKDGDGNAYIPTHLETLVSKYSYATITVDAFLSKMQRYLSPFYVDFDGGVMNEAEVEAQFRVRIKKLRDKRFKKEKQIKKGLEQEKERIALLRKAYVDFNGYWESGIVAVEEVTVWKDFKDGSRKKVSGNFAINLNKDDRNSNTLTDFVKTYEFMEGENGEPMAVATAKDMCVVLLSPAEEKYDYGSFESLAFVNYLIERYLIIA